MRAGQTPWRARILTLFPEMFPGPLGQSSTSSVSVELSQPGSAGKSPSPSPSSSTPLLHARVPTQMPPAQP